VSCDVAVYLLKTPRPVRIWPFSDASGGREQKKGKEIDELGIKAIMVFHDPRDWGRDTQLMLDVLIPAREAGREVKLIFCNPDLLWKADYPRPRLGQGAFREAFQAVHTVG
jgi:ribonucleotide monophosphatase NagD (HAD superfamily)